MWAKPKALFSDKPMTATFNFIYLNTKKNQYVLAIHYYKYRISGANCGMMQKTNEYSSD